VSGRLCAPVCRSTFDLWHGEVEEYLWASLGWSGLLYSHALYVIPHGRAILRPGAVFTGIVGYSSVARFWCTVLRKCL
jgi:hypothetical protein